MKDWYPSVYKSFLYVSVILFIISFTTSGNAKIDSAIAGYSTTTLCILIIMTILTNNVYMMKGTTWETLKAIFFNSGPFLLMLAVIGMLLYLVIYYKNSIAAGHVAPGYYIFSNISTILVLLQILVINNALSNDNQLAVLNRVTSGMIYLIGVFNMISVLISFTMLKYYTTDG